MLKNYYYGDDNAVDIFCILSLDEILDPSNKIAEFLDETWKHAVTLKWADPPGDLRNPGDSMPSISVSTIKACSNTFGETVDLLRVHASLKPDEREYLIDAKILVDPEEFQYLIHESAIDPSTHNICAYDKTRDDIKSMVVIKHFLEQLVCHLKPKFGLMYTSRVLRRYVWLSRDQRASLMCNKKEEK